MAPFVLRISAVWFCTIVCAAAVLDEVTMIQAHVQTRRQEPEQVQAQPLGAAASWPSVPAEQPPERVQAPALEGVASWPSLPAEQPPERGQAPALEGAASWRSVPAEQPPERVQAPALEGAASWPSLPAEQPPERGQAPALEGAASWPSLPAEQRQERGQAPALEAAAASWPSLPAEQPHTSINSPLEASTPWPSLPVEQPHASIHSFGSVPVYGYDRVQGNSREWMLMFPQDFSTNRLQEFCGLNISAPARCVYVGHPSQGGLHYVTVKGYEPEVSVCVGKSRGPRFIEVDGPTRLLGSPGRGDVPWNLDRIDNGREGVDGSYTQGEGGDGVHVYHFDTGIRTGMRDFEGRAVQTLDIGLASTLDSSLGCGDPKLQEARQGCAFDLQGHGTHTAGTIGGRKYGVAKRATIHAVKILNDQGYGSWSVFISGIDWVMTHGQRPAIISASLGGSGKMLMVKEAIDGAVAHDITVVVAAGNDSTDTCQFTPAYVRSAISVGASDEDDKIEAYSNWGACLDVFAPGGNIVSLDIHKGTGAMSGTSMSAPHVAGVAALILGANPNLTPAEVQARIVSGATRNALHGTIKEGTKNRLLFVGPKVTQMVTLQALSAEEVKPPYQPNEMPPPEEETSASELPSLPQEDLKPPYSPDEVIPPEEPQLPPWIGPGQ